MARTQLTKKARFLEYDPETGMKRKEREVAG
jgi:hypothetical protein